MPKPIVLAVVVSMACFSVPAGAATAHNSQAGAYGGTKNNCAATAYFPEGTGCISPDIEGLFGDGGALPPRAPHGRRRPLPPSDDD